MENSADPDQMASSDLDLHCFLKRIYLVLAGQELIKKHHFTRNSKSYCLLILNVVLLTYPNHVYLYFNMCPVKLFTFFTFKN